MAASRRPEPRPSGENVSVRQPQYRQDAYSSPTLVDDNQCTGSQVDVMLHVNHELDAHVRASGTSRSSTLHAA